MGTQLQENKDGKMRKIAKDGIDLRCKAWSNETSVIETSRRKGSGYLFDIILTKRLPIPPKQMMALLSNPDNAHLFRDYSKTIQYKVMKCNNEGKQTIHATHMVEMNFLLLPVFFYTPLELVFDFENCSMKFKLRKWGIMRKFDGEWIFKPIIKDNKIVGTHATLLQEAMPLIVPPLLTSFLQGIATNAVIRFVEDLESLVERYCKGEGFEDILKQKYLDDNPWLKEWRLNQKQEWDVWQSHLVSENNSKKYLVIKDNADNAFIST